MVSNPTGEARRIIRGFQWTYASVALQGFLKLAALMVLARLLTPREFGLLGFALLCTNFVERIGQGGVAPTVVQVESVSPEAISTAWWLSLVLGVFSTATVALCAGPVAGFFGEPELIPILRVLSLGCLLEALVSIPEALLQRELRCREIMIADNLAYCISMVGVCTALAYAGWGVWSLVVAQVSLKIVKLVVLLAVAPAFERRTISWVHARYLARMGFGFSLGRLLNFFSLQGDNFVVGRLLGTEALGMYNRAYQLMTLPAMYVGQVFERVMFPAMARKQSKSRDIAEEFLLALEVLTIVALPAGVVMFVLAGEIVSVGFGDRWTGVVPAVSVLSFGVFFRTAYKCSDTAVRSVGAVYHYAARQALYAILVIGGAFIGALIGGVTGVAGGVVCAVAINYFSMTRLSMRLLRVPLRYVLRAHIVGLWTSACVAVALALSVDFLRMHSKHSLFVLLIAGGIAATAWLVSVAVAIACVPFGSMLQMRKLIVDYRGTSFHGDALQPTVHPTPTTQHRLF
jgi:O-antigen/teichoic acid export membrane protein